MTEIKPTFEEVKAVVDLVRSAGDELDILYGPGHIVLDDWNLGNSSILFCLNPEQWFSWFDQNRYKFTGASAAWEFEQFMENNMKAMSILHDLLDHSEEAREAASEWLWENQ